jgi:hypothetical protein
MRLRPIAPVDVGALRTQYLAGLLKPIPRLAGCLQEPLMVGLEVLILDYPAYQRRVAGRRWVGVLSVLVVIPHPLEPGMRWVAVGSGGVSGEHCRP